VTIVGINGFQSIKLIVSEAKRENNEIIVSHVYYELITI
jgi:hypothetical protein